MLKSEARKIFNSKRSAISHLETVFVYAATKDEVETDTIVDYLHFQNPALGISYPVVDFATQTMNAVLTNTDTEFVKNQYGIAEPDSQELVRPDTIDLILVPLLCFDKDGFRVGYGKGFYDKYLVQTRSDAIKVGLCYYEPIDKIDDRNNFDVPLNYCITPERLYEF